MNTCQNRDKTLKNWTVILIVFKIFCRYDNRSVKFKKDEFIIPNLVGILLIFTW